MQAERAHLREILLTVPPGTGPAKMAAPVATYVAWAGGRLLNQLSAHRGALQAVPTIAAATRAQLSEVSSAASHAVEAAAARSPNVQAKRLLTLLDAWSDSLDAVAGATLRTRPLAPGRQFER